MVWWIIYDIAAPKRLRNVARLCQSAGLHRVQKSVFVGVMPQERVMSLREALMRWIDREEDKILLFPVSAKEMRSAISLGTDSCIGELAGAGKFRII